MQFVAVTGTGSGFGEALANELTKRGIEFMSIGRTHHPGAKSSLEMDLQANYINFGSIPESQFSQIEALFLNAFLTEIPRPLADIRAEDLCSSICSNVSANKSLIDRILSLPSRQLKMVVEVSSGAAMNSYSGWGPYSASKALMGSLLRTYQAENDDVLFRSISPGVLETPLNALLIKHAEGRAWADKLVRERKDPKLVAPQFLDACFALTFESSAFLSLSTR